jgi:hypothetical protein
MTLYDACGNYVIGNKLFYDEKWLRHQGELYDGLLDCFDDVAITQFSTNQRFYSGGGG